MAQPFVSCTKIYVEKGNVLYQVECQSSVCTYSSSPVMIKKNAEPYMCADMRNRSITFTGSLRIYVPFMRQGMQQLAHVQ